MSNFSLRRVETQARVSFVMSIASVVTLLSLIFLVVQKADLAQWVIIYGAKRRAAVLIAGALTLLLAVAGTWMGISSVGQRRNDRPGLSWLAFFLGAGVLCLALVTLFLFKVRGEMAIVQS